MGEFDFDCIVCGGDQCNQKSSGYFCKFECRNKSFKRGECFWCEGCTLRYTHISDLISFHNSVTNMYTNMYTNSIVQFNSIKDVLKMFHNSKDIID